MSRHLVVMAAGTGGHIIPGLAVAREMKQRGWTVSWLGTTQGMENQLVPKAGIPLDRLCASFAETGNTSSASIPLLLDDLVKSGKAKKGEKALMVGFGASFAVGSALAVIS